MSLTSANMSKYCSSCKKYLSVKPLHQYANGDIKCGRCVISNDGGIPVWPSDVSEDALFRCTNHYDGCRSLLKYWEVMQHEADCSITSSLDCPFCPSNTFKCSSLFLLHHLKEDHADSVLNYPKITLALPSLDRQVSFVLYTDDSIFTICVRKSPEIIEISLSFICTSGIDFNQMSTNITACSQEPKIDINLPPVIPPEYFGRVRNFVIPYSYVKDCCSIDLEFRIFRSFSPGFDVQQILGPHIYPKIVSFEFDLSRCRTVIMRSNGNIPSFCGLCKVSFYQKIIFKCESGEHYICSACRYFDIHECEDGKKYVNAIDEEHILVAQQYCCKWNCYYKDSFSYINRHEIECNNQPTIMCPESSCTLLPIFSSMRGLFEHYQRTHSFTNIKVYDYWTDRNVPTGVFVLKDIQKKQEWNYYVSNVFVKIKSEATEEKIQFLMEICNENLKKLLSCWALVKYGEQHSQLEKNSFNITINNLQNLCVRIFLRPADFLFALPGFIKNDIN